MHTFTAAPPGNFLAMLRRNADIDQRPPVIASEAENFLRAPIELRARAVRKAFSRAAQSFSGSIMAGDFFGAAEAAGATDAAAGGGVAMTSKLICGLASTAAPGAVVLFGSAIGRTFAAGLASSSGLREASAAGRGRGSGGISGMTERVAPRGPSGRTSAGSTSAVLVTMARRARVA